MLTAKVIVGKITATIRRVLPTLVQSGDSDFSEEFSNEFGNGGAAPASNVEFTTEFSTEFS